MLDAQAFKTVINNTPLVSIDLCLVFEDQLLMGKRKNNPLKGEWFTPGGRILKNESWQHALLRIVNAELGLYDINVENFVLMGVWDHFYDNSALGQDISTHYVNLPHYIVLESKPFITLDNQHDDVHWFDLEDVIDDKKLHPYMRNYSNWLLNNMDNTHD